MIAAVRRIGRFFPLAACVKVALLQSLLSLTLLCGQLSAAWAEQTDRLFRVGVTAFRDKANPAGQPVERFLRCGHRIGQ